MVSQPYQDSPGPEPPTEVSSGELHAFYDDVEKTGMLERKLSRRNSHSGASIWSRKSIQRTVLTPVEADLPRIPSTSNIGDSGKVKQLTSPDGQTSDLSHFASSRSLIANGSTQETSDWEENNVWASVPSPAFRVHYPLHNPLGPRWYKNQHLIPPSQKKPSMRPPTFFSSSFPPMHTSSSPEQLDDPEDPGNGPSRSPLPTPTSSQTRVGDGGKPRSRKTSQTTPDTVDLLDVSDPWGTNWHHQSPYDIGQTTTVAAPPTADLSGRPRRASMTATQNHKSMVPSPLFQSTSAIHLHSTLPAPITPEIHIPRKLSKRRTPTVANVFAPLSSSGHQKAASAPVTPVDRSYMAPSSSSIIPLEPPSLPKRMSVAPALPFSSMQPTPKKEKRGSMLNRIAKKFSLLRKSTDDHEGRSSDWWNHVEKHEAQGYGNSYVGPIDKGRISPEKPLAGSVKRVPPPSVDASVETPPPEPPKEPPKEPDRVSVTSIEAPFSMGRLTITNPDTPDPDNGRPSGDQSPPPPPEKPKDAFHIPSESDGQTESSLTATPAVLSRRISTDARSNIDKPLPPPQLATPQFSLLGLSEFNTPTTSDAPLPPAAPAVSNVTPPSPSPSPPDTTEKQKDVPLPRVKTPSPQPKKDITPEPVFPDRRTTHSPSPIDTQPVSESEPKRSSPVKESPIKVETTLTERSRSQNLHSNGTVRRTTTRAHQSPAADVSTNRKRSSRDKDSRDRSGEASTSSRQYRSNSRSEAIHAATAPAPARVPFPTSHTLGPSESHKKTQPPPPIEYEGSPMSTSSVLVNPPTPYDNRVSIALSDQSTPPTLPPKSIYEVKTSTNLSPTNPSPSRQTETFKLVRSLSGHVYASSETIMAAGQQWEVVESIEAKPKKEKTPSKSKDQEYRSRDREYRSSREQESKSRDYDRSSREHESRTKDDRKSRNYDHKSRDYDRLTARDKDYEQRTKAEQRQKDYERKYREEQMLRDYESKSKDEHRVKEEHRSRDYDKIRSRDYKEEQRSREYDERRSRDYESKSKDEYRIREYPSKSKDNIELKDYEQRPKESTQRTKDYERKSTADYGRRDHDIKPENNYRKKDSYESKSTDCDNTLKESPHKLKDYDRGPRPNSKPALDDVDFRHSAHRASKLPSAYHDDTTKTQTNGKTDSRHREERFRHDDSKSSRKREPKSEKKPTIEIPNTPHQQYLSAPAVSNYIYGPPEVAEPPTRRLERNPSLNARPTSELPSAAEMNAVRAKESWEMERLWKARSMYGLEQNGTITNYIPESSSNSTRSDDVNTHSAVYGSSHTAYVVQSPFSNNLGSQIYHSMPTGPPPIIYSSPASIPSIPDTFSTYEPYDNVYRSYATATTATPSDSRTSTSLPRPPLNNPLPEPPRESDIDLSSFKGVKSSSTNDYWTMHNGITTLH